jgi:hypothetical protein
MRMRRQKQGVQEHTGIDLAPMLDFVVIPTVAMSPSIRIHSWSLVYFNSDGMFIC